MSWNTIGGPLDLSSVKLPAGPDELAEIFVAARQSPFFCDPTHLSDESLRKLIRVAYYGSQKPEEGRYPICRFFSYPKANMDHELFTAAVFNPPIPLTISEMPKLAQIAERERHALVVVEQGDEIQVDRLMSLDVPKEVNTALGRPEIWTSCQIPHGLMLTIDGPGALQISSGSVTRLKLRAGEIRQHVTVSIVPGVKAWYESLADRLHKKVISINPKAAGYFHDELHSLVAAVWSQILVRCVNARHGGAFVIAEPNGDTIRCKYRVHEPDLGESIVQFWLACVEATSKPTQDNQRLWLRRHNQFRKQLDAVSSLANVDGCVCLSPDLKVLGFGGEIQVDEGTANASPLQLIDDRTEKPAIRQDSHLFGGTRHRSAFRLCKTKPHTLAFVISQDGDLGVFYSDNESVHAYRSLGAWFFNALEG
jgi:hypothetical protein